MDAAQRLTVLEAICLDILKQATKQMEAAALETAKTLIADAGDALPDKFVARIDFGNSGKTNSAIMKVFTKAKKTGSFMIISADTENDAVCVYANVAKTQVHVDVFYDALAFWVLCFEHFHSRFDSSLLSMCPSLCFVLPLSHSPG